MPAVVRLFPKGAPSMSNVPDVPAPYVRKWARPMPKTRPNVIPHPDWLAYNWQGDRDPELEFVLSAIEQSGMSLEWISDECERQGHRVRVGTMLNWFYRGTRQPKNCTINAVMRAISWTRSWTQVG